MIRSAALVALAVLAAALLVAFSGPTAAPTRGEPGSRAHQEGSSELESCDLHGYVTDPDPAGLNVRAGPGSGFDVVGTLPSSTRAGTRIHIAEGEGRWLRFDAASVVPYEEEEGEDLHAAGEGWVYGGLVGVDFQEEAYGRRGGGPWLYAAPREDSDVVQDLEFHTSLRFVGCRGEWAHVEAAFPGGDTARGWLHPANQCASPETTCS